MTWHEVAQRCYQRRYSDFDVTVGVVMGAMGFVVVDTRASVAQGERLRDDLRRLRVERPQIVNTHGHFDHCFGNAAFGGPFWGHSALPAYLAGPVREMLALEFPAWAESVRDDPVIAPDRVVEDRARIDLGDRVVELRHFGRAHTDHDLTIWVPDAHCIFTGDLVEQSGPPGYGPDSFPLEWPDSLARLIGAAEDAMGAADAVLVPGHGTPVDLAFATAQHEQISLVAARIREAHAAGLSVDEALAAGGWPYPTGLLRDAVRRGFEQLG